MFAQSYFSAKKIFGISSYDAIKLVEEDKNIKFEEVVNVDNIYGNVLLNEKTISTKLISILEEDCKVKFVRTLVKLFNIEPKEVYSLTII
jgi:hypothetical protein